jgi:hypothetical protein
VCLCVKRNTTQALKRDTTHASKWQPTCIELKSTCPVSVNAPPGTALYGSHLPPPTEVFAGVLAAASKACPMV